KPEGIQDALNAFDAWAQQNL
ncbi:aspartate kinase [Oceanobacter sp. RED65]|nr:aspartate kinase [Oceanobacter sp. RED65] [Bermanella marisrubri]